MLQWKLGWNRAIGTSTGEFKSHLLDNERSQERANRVVFHRLAWIFPSESTLPSLSHSCIASKLLIFFNMSSQGLVGLLILWARCASILQFNERILFLFCAFTLSVGYSLLGRSLARKGNSVTDSSRLNYCRPLCRGEKPQQSANPRATRGQSCANNSGSSRIC